MAEKSDETLLAEVIEVVSRHRDREVAADTDLVADLNLDSIDIAELVAEIEDHFHVVIPMERLPRIRTVADIADDLAPLLPGGRVTRSA
ncbi:MAG TPA: acyl carrier protein [Pyrinomonadaceae bacterium]|jgi:acyl carrier protein